MSTYSIPEVRRNVVDNKLEPRWERSNQILIRHVRYINRRGTIGSLVIAENVIVIAINNNNEFYFMCISNSASELIMCEMCTQSWNVFHPVYMSELDSPHVCNWTPGGN